MRRAALRGLPQKQAALCRRPHVPVSGSDGDGTLCRLTAAASCKVYIRYKRMSFVGVEARETRKTDSYACSVFVHQDVNKDRAVIKY